MQTGEFPCKFVLLARNCVLTNHAAPGGTGLRVVGVCPAVVWSPHTAPCRAGPSECRHFVLSEDSNDSSVHGTSKGAGSAAPEIIRTFSCSFILATQLWGHLASKQMSFLTTFDNVD